MKQAKRDKRPTLNHWSEIEAGFRGSTLLRLGAIFSAVGALSNLGVELLGRASGPSESVTTVAWLLYIAGLWLLAGGFILTGAHRTMVKFAIFVGIFHGLQGIGLLTILFTFTELPLPPISLTVGRLVALLIFVFMERHQIPRLTRKLLFWAVGLQLAKAIFRTVEWLPSLSAPMGPLVDTTFLLFLSAALLQLSHYVRQEEDTWARQIFDTGHADFADFNNPQHNWNKSQKKKK